MARSPRIVFPALALAGAAFAFYTVLTAQDPTPARPAVSPPSNPYATAVSGSGIVVPPSERNVELGAPFAGVVTSVFVKAGDPVEAGAPLFQLDERPLQAELRTREAALAAALARRERLRALPRPEEVPPLVARVSELEMTLADWQSQVRRMETALEKNPGSVAGDDLERRRWQAKAAGQALERARAELHLTRAGAWAPDLAQAEAEVLQAEAAAQVVRTDLERARVRAPGPGVVLEVNVRVGEYAQAGGGGLVVFGDRGAPLVRVDVDEESAPLVQGRPKALGTLRGFPHHRFPLEFVRIEPYMKPKRSLTGDNRERVDTRVLQVLFRIAEQPLPVYVGQQMDVYMEGPDRTAIVEAGSRPSTGAGR